MLAAPFVVLAAIGLAGRPRRSAAGRRPPRPPPPARGAGHDVAPRRRRPRRRRARHPGRRPRGPRRHARRRTARSAPSSTTGLPTIDFSPRRWGRRAVGAERVALTSAWAGWRWGPVRPPRDQPGRAAQDGAVRHPRRGAAARRPRRPAPVAAGGQRHRVRGHPALRHRRPAEADQLAGLAAHRRAARRHHARRAGRRGVARRRRPARHRRLGRDRRRAPARSTSPCARRPRWPSTTSAPVTGSGCSWSPPTAARVPLGSGPRHLQRLLGTLARIRTEARSTAAGAPRPRRRCRERGPRPVADAVHAAGHRDRQPAARRDVGRRHRHARRRPDRADGADRLALPSLAARMQKIERDDRLRRLAALGCPRGAVARTGHPRHRPPPAGASRAGAAGACADARCCVPA